MRWMGAIGTGNVCRMPGAVRPLRPPVTATPVTGPLVVPLRLVHLVPASPVGSAALMVLPLSLSTPDGFRIWLVRFGMNAGEPTCPTTLILQTSCPMFWV